MSPLSTSRFLRHRDRWITPVVVMRFSFLSFIRNRDLHTAATMAFYGMFALIPLCLAVLFLLSQFFVSSQRASRAIEDLIIQIIPQYYEVILREVFSLAEQKAIGFIGLIPLLWSLVPLVSMIRTGFINVFKTDRNAGFLREKLIDFLAVLLFLLLFIGLVGGQILYAALGETLAQKSGLLGALNDVFTPLAGTLFLALFFMVFSPVRLEWWNILVSAIFTAGLWSVVRPLFVAFLQYNPNYGFAFGSLKAVFVLVVWIYFTFAVILFGTELLSNIRRREALLLSRFFEVRRSGAAPLPTVPSRFIRSHEPGEIIFDENSAGREMFYVLSGSVRILKNGILLREMTAGDYFGEMAMLIQAPRTAAAVASAPDTRLVVISESNLETILRENPKIVVSFLKEMSARLRSLNEKVDDLSESCGHRNGKGDS
ncbi:MAG: YhjD/YihY/BrkB family envelope integrity protein [Syntrophaceae bacterium]